MHVAIQTQRYIALFEDIAVSPALKKDCLLIPGKNQYGSIPFCMCYSKERIPLG
jgi:hypothetical protein